MKKIIVREAKNMAEIQMKIISSLEKCFFDEKIEDKVAKNNFVMFQNEKLSFQVAYYSERAEGRVRGIAARVCLSGELSAYATVREVVNIPSMWAAFPFQKHENYLRTEPGLYPDLLRPLQYNGGIPLRHQQLHALWVDISLPKDFAAGTYSLTVSLIAPDGKESADQGWLPASSTATVQVIPAKLPPQKLIHTEWFYTDCLANYYHVRVFSEKHWKIIENFIRTATQNGINMILTPIFTPELDTYIGGERLTTQLVDITVESKGNYRFAFDKLHRWIDICLSCGVRYFEIPHFFTQWGAKHAPKIVGKVNGRTKKLFGWDTNSLGEEYAAFLGQLIPAVLAEFEKRGLADQCYFHVSDEPSLKSLEQYTRCKNLIKPYVGDAPIIDALSDYEFYESGALKKPVPAIKHIEPFLEHQVEGLWAYYCASDGMYTTNRFFSMPLARTRILGVQLYLYHIEGFLHWGYNFYNNWNSYNSLDPFGESDGGYFNPSGDCYVVYPGTNGEAWESNRLNAMREAMDDIRALQLYESYFGREKTEQLVLEGTDGTLTFKHYPTDAAYLIHLREKIAQDIAALQP